MEIKFIPPNDEKKMELKNKFILDACCGNRYMWFNKNHPNAIYMDIRKEEKGFIESEKNVCVQPDIQADFTKLPQEIKNHKFKLIIWDVPHFKARKLTGVMLKKFGGLNPETWQSDINKGFKELWGILEDYGIILFKFSDYHIKFKDVLNQIPIQPIVINKTSGSGKTETKWFCFMKIPQANDGGINFTQNPCEDSALTSPLINVKRDSAESPNLPQIHNKKLEEVNLS